MAHKHIVYMMLADSAALVGDENAIREYAPLLEDLALRDNHQPYLAIAQRAWGVAHRLAGEHAEAEARLEAALDQFDELNLQWQYGRTLFELGQLANAKSDADTARDYFSQALAAFKEMGAEPDITRTNAVIEALE
jgi:tetratricopeptide (TPR) repeat protein